MEEQIRAGVQDYYGRVLKSQSDLQTGACCPTGSPPAHVRAVLSLVHSEIRNRSYGCGSPIPAATEGSTVLDLGCGTGQDVYVLSRLVGPHGRVIGIDMTREQLAVAQQYREHHRLAFEYERSNVEFAHGYIEDLAACGIDNDSIDVVVSNCVLNLAPVKSRVFSEIFRVLKPGGELYFSDIFADRRLPQGWLADPRLVGECLAGAMYLEDFRRLLAFQGCADARLVSIGDLAVTNDEIKSQVGNVRFYSATVRAFKLPLEDRCEDYGQTARYLGTIPGYPNAFALDEQHLFLTSKPMLVCGNTADMLCNTRYARHFEVIGKKSMHFGLFDCAPGSARLAPGAACC